MTKRYATAPLLAAIVAVTLAIAGLWATWSASTTDAAPHTRYPATTNGAYRNTLYMYPLRPVIIGAGSDQEVDVVVKGFGTARGLVYER